MLSRSTVLAALPAPLAQSLSQHFDRTRAAFADALAAGAIEAMVLSGGYGRAEGGVATAADGSPCLFNDLDYFVFTRNPHDAGLLRRIRQWEVDESDRIGIDVEAVCIRMEQIDASGRSMMFYDFLHRHCVILGEPDAIASRFAPPPHGYIAPVEATRLLWNRGSGLWFARVDLHLPQTPERARLIHRNQAKALLGLGDAWLCLQGKYRPMVAERTAAMASATGVPDLLAQWHATGAAFKQRPTPPPTHAEMAQLQAQLASAWLTLFLQVESARLGVAVADAASYSDLKRRLFPDAPVGKNLLLSLRDRLRRGGYLSPAWDYPRGALQRALPLLLSDPIDFNRVSRHLGARCHDLASANAPYRKWWQYYS